MSDLGNFSGRNVIKTAVAITNAGDGLSQAMKIEPELLELGEKRYVVLECEVAKIRFEEVAGTEALARVHVLRAGTATLIDGEVVREAIDVQREKIDRAREAEAGVQRLPTDHELRGAHVLGEHTDGLVDECPLCQEERGAEAREASDATE